MRKIPEKYWPYFICLALIAVTLAVFWQVHSFDFINYDDNRYVTENRHVVTGLTIDNIIWAFTASHFFMWHPVTSLSHMLDCELFALNAGGHHLVNLAIHIANALLLFEILRRMTNRIWPSAFVAAVFALHPLSVESVAWVAERKNLLSGLFWFLTIVAYIRYVNKPQISNYLLVILVFVLALMAKPTTVTLPFALLLLDYWPLDRFEKLSLWRLFKGKIPLFVLSAGLCVITVITQQSGDVLSLNRQFPFSIRLANALVSYATYICKMIYPVHLTVFYPHPGFSLALWKSVAAFMLLAVISIILLYFGRKKSYLVVGWFWFLGTLVPVIGFVQAGAQAMADRYTYIPLIGLFIIIAWGANDLLINWKHRKVLLTVVAGAIVLVLSVCAWRQTSRWQNSQAVFEHTLNVTSGNYVACNNLGFALLEQDKFDEAISLFQRALQIKPDHVEAYNNLGMAYGKLGRKDEEMQAYQQALKLGSAHAETYHNLGITLNQQGRYREAIDAFKQAIKINPELSQVYYELGSAYGKIGLRQEEMEAYNKAIKMNPMYYQAYTNLGVVYSQLGRFEEAINSYLQAVKIEPDYADAYNNLGVVYGQLGRFRESIEAFQRAVQLKPDFAEAHCGLGISYIMAGDKDSAIKEYEILKKLDTAQADKLFSVISGK